ncbi:MAG: hypothetical protein L3J69_07960 [Desulfobacula sp.]|nr:hypothetical protein [Desulfobacula sp.]
MEDISRELEKEIAQSKPKPYKKDEETRIIIIDDFGQMKSGEYLKYFLRVSLVLTIVCFVVAIVFFKLYSDVSKDISMTSDRLILADKKVDTLTKEKEVLIARLVILGQESIFATVSSGDKKEPQKDKAAASEKNQDEKKMVLKKQKITDAASKSKKKTSVIQAPIKKKQTISIAQESNPNDDLAYKNIKAQNQIASQTKNQVKKLSLENNKVSIEKFTVKNERASGDLLVRFDIRNISKEPGDVSGRIFTILKPDNKPQDQWRVVPKSPLKDGIPSEFRKGQYFSIAHFKPIKFRIKNTSGPDFFQLASIYIFNNQGEIIFEKLIKITEADEAG